MRANRASSRAVHLTAQNALPAPDHQLAAAVLLAAGLRGCVAYEYDHEFWLKVDGSGSVYTTGRPELWRAFKGLQTEGMDDDALRAVRLFASRIADSIVEGNQIATEGGVLPTEPTEGEAAPDVAGAAGGALAAEVGSEVNNGGVSAGEAPSASMTSQGAENAETESAPDESTESVVAAS